MSLRPGVQPFYIDGARGSLFALYLPPAGRQASAHPVLHVPALAEEMNLSRPLVARTARALQAAGVPVLLVDLFGTGDSAGEFHQASVALWQADLARAANWLAERHPGGAPDLWCNRGGGLLVPALAAHGGAPSRMLLWNPVPRGRQWFDRFARVLQLAEGGPAGGLPPRARLAADGILEVAGYRFSAELVAGLDGLALTVPPADQCRELALFEVRQGGQATPSPPLQDFLDRCGAAGLAPTSAVFSGPPYWSTHEDIPVAGLVEESVAFLLGARRGP